MPRSLLRFTRPAHLFLFIAVGAQAQQAGTIGGTVVIESTGQPIHGAKVTLSPMGRTTDTSDDRARDAGARRIQHRAGQRTVGEHGQGRGEPQNTDGGKAVNTHCELPSVRLTGPKP